MQGRMSHFSDDSLGCGETTSKLARGSFCHFWLLTHHRTFFCAFWAWIISSHFTTLVIRCTYSCSTPSDASQCSTTLSKALKQPFSTSWEYFPIFELSSAPRLYMHRLTLGIDLLCNLLLDPRCDSRFENVSRILETYEISSRLKRAFLAIAHSLTHPRILLGSLQSEHSFCWPFWLWRPSLMTTVRSEIFDSLFVVFSRLSCLDVPLVWLRVSI